MRQTWVVLTVLVSMAVVPGSLGETAAADSYVGTADLDGSGLIDAADLLLFQRQWQTSGEASLDSVLPQNRNLPGSLHAVPRGMDYFYSRADGFGPLIGVDYNTLACKNCHVKNCADCHSQPNGTYDARTSCLLKCHSRQNLETATFGFTDVHTTLGFTCDRCHSSEQFHGDGSVHSSFLAPGAPSIHCTDCHTTVNPAVAEHATHGEAIDCAACHLQSVITCYNCHFDSEIDGYGKIHAGAQRNFVMLVNNDEGKVAVASYQALYHNATGTSFVVFAPFYSHSVTAQGRKCGDCHNNAYAQAVNAGGAVVVTEWSGSAIRHATGVIPVVADKMQFEFLNLTNPEAPPAERVWESVGTDLDAEQFGFCTPLDAGQLAILAAPITR